MVWIYTCVLRPAWEGRGGEEEGEGRGGEEEGEGRGGEKGRRREEEEGRDDVFMIFIA